MTKTIHKDGNYTAISPTSPANSAAGKTIVITGGATGTGLATAHSFAVARAAVIALIARRAELLDEVSAKFKQEFPKTTFLTYAISITDPEAVEAAFADVRGKAPAGDVDVVVSSAAYFGHEEGVLGISAQKIRDTFETNVLGPLNLMRAFVGGGRGETVRGRSKVFIDVATHASWILYPASAIYGSTKGAATFVMRHLQVEHPDMRIYSFHPGFILSPAARSLGLAEDMAPWDDDNLPANFALWLASDDSDFLKGRMLWSCWDADELKEQKSAFDADEDLSTIGLRV
ncbi:hypothetical protein BDY21DRAFT_277944 [Lineolata rhizophorae]|uniref:Uncharacterized protein n=1 Tax=Lineolata rhizophorae TaxID=578093 RepID=A0A6A6PDY9_9PEZI|nr:hypothetical protein BDY21DRAFT_277944 [Lineolata rhizophorae]